MKKIFLISIITVICIGSTYTAYAASSGQNTNSGNTVAPLPYTPLEPLPFVYNANSSVNQVKDFPAIINGFFKLVLAFGAVFAVVTLVFYGISYMTSEVAGKKAEAKNRVQAALFGLILLLGAYIILNTINPQLLKINLFLPTVTSPGASPPVDKGKYNQRTTCSEYGVETICNNGNNDLIEQAIQAHAACQDSIDQHNSTACADYEAKLQAASQQLADDGYECNIAYHGTFGQWPSSGLDVHTQNCTNWNKSFGPSSQTFASCIAVPDPTSFPPNYEIVPGVPQPMTWYVCGYNQ